MRHSLLLAFALIVTLFSACKKEDDEDTTVPFVPPYRLSGVTDVSIQKYSVGSYPFDMNIAVEYENGEQERVTLSLENVPTGLYDSIYVKSGFPTFYSTLRFADSGVAEGEYTLKLVATGEGGGRREFPFRVRVLPVANCSAALLGVYTDCYTSCGGGSGTYTAIVQANPSVTNRLVFSNLDNNGLQLYADVICGTGTGGGPSQISLPLQTVNGVTYSGGGYFYTSQGQQSIQLSIQRSTGNSCSVYLER